MGCEDNDGNYLHRTGISCQKVVEDEKRNMNTGGWVFMIFAWGGIITLNIFAFGKILKKSE